MKVNEHHTTVHAYQVRASVIPVIHTLKWWRYPVMLHVACWVICMELASRPELLQTFISQSLQPGPAISMKCSGTGNPLPEIRWFVDSQELLPSPMDPLQARFWQMSDRYSIGSYRHSTTEIVSHINITQVRIEDSGNYKCVASNLVSSAEHSARLNVYGRA